MGSGPTVVGRNALPLEPFSERTQRQLRQLCATGHELGAKKNAVATPSTSNGSELRCDAADLE
jgi:hypothetical protein